MNETTAAALSMLADGATILAAVAAVVAILLTVRQLKMTATEMRENAARQGADSEAQTRPYVAADVVESLATTAYDLVITNQGKTTAKEVQLSLEDGGFRALNDEDKLGPALGRSFARSFDLAPGSRRRVYWRSLPNPKAQPSGEQGAPVKGVIKIKYSWQPDDGRDPKPYEANISYDLTEYPTVAPMPYTGATNSSRGAQMKNLDHAIRAVAQNVGELRR